MNNTIEMVSIQGDINERIEKEILIDRFEWLLREATDILKHIINIASDPNDIVFDPFMGVGSTGVACAELGRRFVGCEIDKIYFKAAKERIDKHGY